jgi:hypothetical protein
MFSENKLSRIKNLKNTSNFKPISKEEAIKEMKELREQLGIKKQKVNEDKLKEILKKSGSLSDEVNKMRKEERTKFY